MISAYAMIPSFLYSGYYWASIAASTAALLVSFVFGYFLMRDLKPVRDVSKPWFLAGLFFAVISSAGVFMLSYMMMSGNVKDRKSTRLNSSHVKISYAVFCLKKKKNEYI